MATRQNEDMRRPDLSETLIPTLRSHVGDSVADRPANMLHHTAVIPYQEPPAKGDSVEFQSTLSSTLPMAAIFMRNRYIGW